jgi:hypothetical protein
VAAHQQVGSFEVVNKQGELQKNGGNVASYFCTPDGRVIHAVTGPVSAGTLLAEAHWAVENYERVGGNGSLLADAHRDAIGPRRGLFFNDGATDSRIHQLLAGEPLPWLNDIYETIFETILGQRVSKPGDDLDQAELAIAAARRAKLPLLFILHKSKDNAVVVHDWERSLTQADPRRANPLAVLARSYVVVVLPLNELPALSSRLSVPPYAAPDTDLPLFVVARSNGRQLTSVTSWHRPMELVHAMAEGIVQEAKEHDRTLQQLRTVLAQVGRVDPSLAEEVQQLDPLILPARPRRRR